MDFDVIVIGAGPAGYVAAIRAAQLGLKTACIEKRETLGGTCLNVGCIPSKTLLHASELFWKIKKDGAHLGISPGDGFSFDWYAMQERKKQVITGLNQGIQGLFKKNKVTWIVGEASFKSPSLLLIVTSGGKQQTLSSKYFIVATGSYPVSLPFLPFDEQIVVSSTGALHLSKIPKHLAVIGAGVIGVELGSVFQRLGSKVSFIEFMDRICPQFDVSLSLALQEALKKQDMEFHLSSKVVSAKIHPDAVDLMMSSKDGNPSEEEKLSADVVLVAVGRKPFTQGLSLDQIGISLTPQGRIPIDENFRTLHSHILAIGDVVEGPMLAHKASEEGVAAAEICAGHSPFLSYAVIPNVVYTYPEVASVGFTEEELKQKNIPFTSGSYPFKGNSRAKCIGEEEGFVKILADAKQDKVLGIHMIGPHVSELVAEASLAMGKSVHELSHLCHAHPTLSEGIKEAALALQKKAIHK